MCNVYILCTVHEIPTWSIAFNKIYNYNLEMRRGISTLMYFLTYYDILDMHTSKLKATEQYKYK